ncbi:hypothetical protein [Streptomyces sp. NPDC029003]|uniref:hypothetical protein n=1 Tax=Streptomyces sp. NPDC029003 TaxID=3155125 RepID=UPI0033C6CBC4
MQEQNRGRIARPAVWALVNVSALVMGAVALVVNNLMFGRQGSWWAVSWTSAWVTAVAACVAYAVVEKAPVLVAAIGARRPLSHWAMEMADQVADWAELEHCGRCGAVALVEYVDVDGAEFDSGARACGRCGHMWRS